MLAGEHGPHRDIVVLNAAAALWWAAAVDSVAAGMALAGEVLDDGRAAAALERLRDCSVAAAEADLSG